MEFSVHEAKTQLSRLLDLVQEGEEIIIRRHGKPIARLVPVLGTARSPFGALRGEIKMIEGWERSLDETEAEAFWEGKW